MAESRDPSLIERIRSIELPECRCPYEFLPCDCREHRKTGRCDHFPHLVPCRHVRAFLARSTAQSEEVAEMIRRAWARDLLAAFPGQYAEPATLAPASNAVSREARVQTMRLRFRAGLCLWNPGDTFTYGAMDDLIQAGEECDHGRNGADLRRPARAASRDSEGWRTKAK